MHFSHHEQMLWILYPQHVSQFWGLKNISNPFFHKFCCFWHPFQCMHVHQLLQKTTLFTCFLIQASYPALNTSGPPGSKFDLIKKYEHFIRNSLSAMLIWTFSWMSPLNLNHIWALSSDEEMCVDSPCIWLKILTPQLRNIKIN